MAACRMVPNGFDLDRKYGAFAPMADVLALRAQPYMWRMNLKTGESREIQLDDAVSEFPVVNNGYGGRKTNYSYHVIFDDCIEQRFVGLMKYNLETGASQRHMFAAGMFGSEPAFAPRIGAECEDDGYLITFATDAAGASEAQILDAQNITAPALARVKLPQTVPLGFHGTWVAGV